MLRGRRPLLIALLLLHFPIEDRWVTATMHVREKLLQASFCSFLGYQNVDLVYFSLKQQLQAISHV